jgi:RNA polymerase sigma-70 factor (ECF subfamily)
MTTRTWTGRVATDWKLQITRPGSADAAPDAREDWSAADDQTLVAACLAGDRAAFDPIVERYRRQVYNVCFRFSGNHADASDLAQDTFIRAYRGLRGFKGRSALGTWLYRIAVNVCLNRTASKAPRETSLRPDRLEDANEPPDRTLLREERAERVRAAIARLPRKQRATLILRVYHDLRHDEIARVLGGSVGAVKANFFHALVNLKKLLQ